LLIIPKQAISILNNKSIKYKIFLTDIGLCTMAERAQCYYIFYQRITLQQVLPVQEYNKNINPAKF